MKKILMTLVAILSMTVAMAQPDNGERKGPKKMTHEEMTNRMVSQLKLNDAQKTKVAALNKEYQDYLMPEPPKRPDGECKCKKEDTKKPDNKGHRPENNREKHQEYEKKLKKILTDDQFKSYQEMGPRGKGKGPKDKRKD